MPEAVALVRHAQDLDPPVGQAEAAMDHQAETAVEGVEDHCVTAVVVEERLHGMGPRTCQLARRAIAISVPCRRSSRRESLRTRAVRVEALGVSRQSFPACHLAAMARESPGSPRRQPVGAVPPLHLPHAPGIGVGRDAPASSRWRLPGCRFPAV
jgi:hypothetical protein